MKGWSKATRIRVMIALDTVFMLIELTVGYWVGSLALVADAFHMLNDIISLGVGLWAVTLARKETTDKYSYGWLRAEILGAFFNATFLIGLCLTIILEALQRFFNPPEITNPVVILIVGCCGLASNGIGFLVLGGHGHSHGGGAHEHDHGGESHKRGHGHAHHHGELSAAEGGVVDQMPGPADEDGRIADLLPEAAIARYTNGPSLDPNRHISFTSSDTTRDGARSETLERCGSRASTRSRGRQRGRTSSLRHNRGPSIDDIRIHPSSFRQQMQELLGPRSQSIEEESGSGSDDSCEENPMVDDPETMENTPLLQAGVNGIAGNKGDHDTYGTSRSFSRRSRRDSVVHMGHHHNKPKEAKKGHGHSHGDMGMNGLILHVLGDALGNIGVIATAIIIWKAPWKSRYYADPIVSLLITVIILWSAIPLTKLTSKVLLQAVPDNIHLNEIREDINDLPGVRSCHHVHVWQLSDTKLVASLHIEVEFPISGEGGEKYMQLAKQARKCLHAYGIHSATIQPEFRLDVTPDRRDMDATQRDGTGLGPRFDNSQPASCLLECVDDCVGQGCCSTGSKTLSPPTSSHSAHSPVRHDHNHGHDHEHEHEH